jgi:hypothetical protein
MSKLELKYTIPVNDYTTIHPAIDFYDNKAIVSVGCKWQEMYNVIDKKGKIIGEEVKFSSCPYCIISNGDKFRYSKKELSIRNLFYNGKIELPEKSRWSFSDIDKWANDNYSPTFTELYNLIKEEFEYYVDYSDPRYYSLLSLFVIYTYFFPMFYNAPVLQFWGEMRTGKTKSLSLLEAMVFNPINSANISSASVFRLIEGRRCTILFDESEDLMTSDRSREIRNMLLAGTGKSGETYRQEKGSDDSYKTQVFKVFSPKVIAHISGIDMPALLSRIIRIGTTASKNKEKLDRCIEIEDYKWQVHRNNLYRICLTRFHEVEKARDELKSTILAGRTFFIWQGILAIASLISTELKDEMEALAFDNKEEIESEIEDFNDDPQAMIKKLLELLDLENQQYYTPNELFEILQYSMDLSSKRDVGFKLGKLGLRSRMLVVNGKSARYYHFTKEKLQRLLKA